MQTTGGWPTAQPKKKGTRKLSTVDKYLKYLEWADKKKLPAFLTYPTMSQNFSAKIRLIQAPDKPHRGVINK